MRLWGGNYEAAPDDAFWEFNRSFPFDRRLVREEIAASRAWVRALGRCGALPPEEAATLERGLDEVLARVEKDPAYLDWTSRTCTASSRSGSARSSATSPARRTSAAAGTSRR